MYIRKANINDIGGLNSLLYQVLNVHHSGRPDIFKSGGKKYTDEELLSIIADDSRPIFVAVEDDAVMGYAFCVFQQHKDNNILTDIKTIYIDDLCVDENARGKHIGTQLTARRYCFSAITKSCAIFWPKITLRTTSHILPLTDLRVLCAIQKQRIMRNANRNWRICIYWVRSLSPMLSLMKDKTLAARESATAISYN